MISTLTDSLCPVFLRSAETSLVILWLYANGFIKRALFLALADILILCLPNSLKIATRICQFSQYLGTKHAMLFEIAKSVEIVTILRKTFILP